MTDLRQLHFRFRTDAGTADASPTWGAGEDVNYYPGTSNFRLRIGLRNASTVVAATPWELYVSKNGDAYTPVTTTISKGVQSVDAGASADDTQVLIPRLYPFTTDWMLSGAAIDIDFAGGRIYPGASFTDYLSISRASTGYATTAAGALTSFSSNQLRITDLGLLVEDARTNVHIFSEVMNSWANPVFSNIGTPTDNATTAPNGATTAAQVIENTLNTTHTFADIINSQANATTYTYSHFIKPNGRTKILIDMSDDNTGDANKLIDLTTNTVSAGPLGAGNWTSVSAVVEDYTNGWKRVALTGTANPGVTFNMTARIWLADASGNTTYTGDGASGVFAWGAQVEAGAAFASSYIPTTGTSATRAADSITISGAAQTTIAAATASMVAQTGNARGTNFAANIVDSNGTNVLGFDATNHAVASLVATLATSNTANRSTTDDKLGLAWSGTGRSLVLNGGTVVTDASAQTPSSTQKLGSANGTSNFIYAYVERLTLWNTKLADATLDSLTV